jgi:hypothetical protein
MKKLESTFMAVAFAEAGEFDTAVRILEDRNERMSRPIAAPGNANTT